ncbi:MAG TPA: glycosyltransferase family 9 protein [Candidatus Binatia bacterium]|nr:glycosyltransferase family 9 protein [Candidatus Binatia bacterium]
MRRIREHPLARRIGSIAGRAGRDVSGRVLRALLGDGPSDSIGDLGDVRRVLLVRPNFRIGNTLLVTQLVRALADRFPSARIDVLGADTTASLLVGPPVDRVHRLSRLFLLRPWLFVALVVRLRRARYDVAIDGGLGSFSGGLYAYLTGARHRFGAPGKADPFLTARLDPEPTWHAYDAAAAFARCLGARCPDRPVLPVGDAAAKAAASALAAAGLGPGEGGDAPRFAALFVGGHARKRWEPESWIALARRLGDGGLRVAILVGPEERATARALGAALGDAVAIVPPQPLDVLAAILSAATVVITPDSGPMHLAVAVGTPTIAVLRSKRSLMYAPRGADDRALVDPHVDDVARAAISHPAWARVGAPDVAAGAG